MQAAQPTPGTWHPLWWSGAIAAWATVALIPVQLVTFALQPVTLSGDAAGWFDFIRGHPWMAFVALDGLLVIDYMLLVPIMAAIFVVVWRDRPSLAVLGLAFFLVATPAFFASNPAIEMFQLAGRHASGDEAVQSQAIGSAETLLVHSQGTVFHANYVLGSVAGVLLSWAMLGSASFHRAGAWAGIIGNLIGFGLYIPVVGLWISAFSGLVLVAWYVYVGLDLVKLARRKSDLA